MERRSSDGSIRILNTTVWQLSAILEGDGRDTVSALSLSWNDRLLASASFDNTARLWDLSR
jgi:WD40 repeat protein